jgi:AraC-like DNA-binding protein
VTAKKGGGATLSFRLLAPFTRALFAADFDLSRLRGTISLDAASFGDPDGRVAHDAAMRLLAKAVQASGDQALGIHAAEQLRPGDFDAFEYVVRASRSIRDALEAAGRYLPLLHDAAASRLVRKGDDEFWILTLPEPAHPAAMEFALAAVVLMRRTVLPRASGLRAVLFAHLPPRDRREHERVFGAPIEWNAGMTALRLDPAYLDSSFARANPTLSAALHRHAQQLLADLAPSRGYATRVREYVIAALQSGETDANAIARRMKTSTRTLRRRLLAEGTTYTDVLADVRRELALRYLTDSRLSVEEVAFLLGFSTVSAFRRAFQRWTGDTPSEYRRKRA